MAVGGTSRRRHLAVIAGAALLLLPGLGLVDAWAPDEPRYLEVAEELRAMERGPSDLVLLHLNGRPYDQKPPLYFWLAALAATRGAAWASLPPRARGSRSHARR